MYPVESHEFTQFELSREEIGEGNHQSKLQQKSYYLCATEAGVGTKLILPTEEEDFDRNTYISKIEAAHIKLFHTFLFQPKI